MSNIAAVALPVISRRKLAGLTVIVTRGNLVFTAFTTHVPFSMIVSYQS